MDAAVVGRAGWQVEVSKDAADVRFDGLLAQEQWLVDPAVGRGFLAQPLELLRSAESVFVRADDGRRLRRVGDGSRPGPHAPAGATAGPRRGPGLVRAHR